MAQDTVSSTRRLAKAGLMIQLFALLMLACFRSDKLITFVYDLPPGALDNRLVEVAEVWNGWMERFGFAAVTQGVVATIERARGTDSDL